MPSTFAYLSLFLWPVVVFVLFRKRPLNEALAWSIIGGYLLLPQFSAFDLPMLPPVDKKLVPSLFAAIMCFALLNASRAQKFTRARSQSTGVTGPGRDEKTGLDAFKVQRGNGLLWVLLLLLFGSPFLTAFTNTEPIVQENRFVSGMRFYDSLSINLKLLVSIAPFLLARRFLFSAESHLVLLKVFVLSALGYSLLALWEVRMSPQLHSQVYGFFPHSWRQHVRGGGFRPVVFLNHGLWVAILLAMGTLAALSIWRVKLRLSEAGATRWLLGGIWLFAVVILSKSAGALLISVMLLPLVILFGVRLQMLAAATIVGIILIYPSLRGADVVPTDAIHSSLAKLNAERANSLQIRFDAEDKLLAHANQKPLAGWGSWGRNRVTNEKGADIAATDGYWAIVIGVYGWLGYIAQFGLIGAAILFLSFNRKKLDLSPATAGLTIVLAAALIDLIPNATISPIVWLIAGSLMGHYQTAQATEKKTIARVSETAVSAPPPRSDPDLRPARNVTPTSSSKPRHIRRPREG